MEIQNTEELIGLLGLVKPVESLKIEKNSKGYNWEYKLVGTIENSINERIDNIEEKLKAKFGEKKDENKN